MGLIAENMPSNTAHAPIQLGFHKEGSTTSTDLGSVITSDGISNRAWTLGSNDVAFEIQPVISIKTHANYVPNDEDPRIRSFWVQGVTPQVYRVEIPLTKAELRGTGNLGVPGSLKALRALKGREPVAVREPGMNDSFNGYVTDIEETNLPGGEYILTLRLQRFDWSTDS